MPSKRLQSKSLVSTNIDAYPYQEVRFAIEDVSGGEEYAHRLKDFNNTRSYEEVLRVLVIATERVESRLQNN